MSRPTVGVVIPVYRAEDQVAGCLASIAAQTVRPEQLVLVDDRGGDRSIAVAEQAARRHGLPVEVITQPENRGPSAARNAGLARLRTDLVWFCDADDTAAPRFLQDLLAALAASGAPWAMCRTARVDAAGRLLSIDERPLTGATMTGLELAERLLLGDVRGYSCNKLFRREALGSAPFPEGVAYEDLAPILRLALAAPEVALVDAPHYRYLRNEESLSRRFGPHLMDLLVQDVEVHEVLAPLLSGAEGERWRRLLVHYRYDGVVLPAANMALRALTGARAEGRVPEMLAAQVREVVSAARSLIRPADLRVLTASGARRQAVAAAVLKASPAAYRRILAYR